MSLIIFIMLYILTIVQSEEDDRKHFKKECGIDNPMTPNDCIFASIEGYRCCFATGQEVLESKSICVTVENYEQSEYKQQQQAGTGHEDAQVQHELDISSDDGRAGRAVLYKRQR